MRRPSDSNANSVERLAFLEGIRGLAALYVVIGHIFNLVAPIPWKASPWILRLGAPFAYGHLAVAGFIVVSGFSLQLGLFQRNGAGEVRSLKAFFARRAFRILPAYYACLAISIAVALTVTPQFNYPPFTTYLPVTLETVLAHVFLIHNFNRDWMYTLNGVLWSIAIEAQLYLFFPVLSNLLLRRGRGVLLIFAGLIGLGLNVWCPAAWRLWFFFLFAVGMMAANLAYRPPLYDRDPRRTLGIFGWLLALVTIGALSFTKDHALTDIPFGLTLAALCALGTIGGGGWIIRLLGSRPLAVLGKFSYSLYLMHHPIVQLVYAARPASVTDEGSLLAWLFLAGLPAMLLGAWLFSLAFERPFMRLRRSKSERAGRTVPPSLPLPGLSSRP